MFVAGTWRFLEVKKELFKAVLPATAKLTPLLKEDGCVVFTLR